VLRNVTLEPARRLVGLVLPAVNNQGAGLPRDRERRESRPVARPDQGREHLDTAAVLDPAWIVARAPGPGRDGSGDNPCVLRAVPVLAA